MTMKVIVFLRDAGEGTSVQHGYVASVSKVDQGLQINSLHDDSSIHYRKEEWDVVVIKND